MAVLESLPDQAIISALKGIIDFYLYKGIPVARKWPEYPPRTPSPSELFNQQDFAYINEFAVNLAPAPINEWRDMAKGTIWTWKDAMVKAYMSGLAY